MDCRSWPWKKKFSEKTASQGDQDSNKKPSYIQISLEQYSLLTSLKDEVKNYEEQIHKLEDLTKDLNDKLSAANEEITAKDSSVKQHSKVAEEAVSGWEKAEAEASALKTHLESVTLWKLAAEDRAENLDGALKECMRQIRGLKEENEQKLQDVFESKTKQMDRLRDEFEAKIADFERELLQAAAENNALSRSLKERSNMLIRISEGKSQADCEIEHLKENIESCEREINSLKYELHVNSRELEIRNEEKNMSMRSAEAASKQNMESIKKISKLEAECQRLRGLVRKKLAGPTALAQMKMEVESLDRDYGDSRIRRSPVRPSSPLMSPMSHVSQMSESSLDNVQKLHKENKLLTERLLAMEEETRMLKEALAKRNNELQVSRNLCAETANRLQACEVQLMSKSPTRSDSLSESVNHFELMDDFLEMEKLACLSNDSSINGSTNVRDSPNNKRTDTVSTRRHTHADSDAEEKPAMQLKERISGMLQSLPKDIDIDKILSEIQHVVRDARGDLSVRVEKENRANQRDSSSECCQNAHSNISGTASDPEVLEDDSVTSNHEPKVSPSMFTADEFEVWKIEKDKAETDLATCEDNLEATKCKLRETEERLAEVKLELASAQMSNRLAETQLRCMVESYRSLETRSTDLEIEVNSLKEKLGSLENELHDEEQGHRDAETRCQELEERLQRNHECPTCSSAEADQKNRQDKELVAATEKLAECQETIMLLGKQVKYLCPQADQMERTRKLGDETLTSGNGISHQDFDQTDAETASSCSNSDKEIQSMKSPDLSTKMSKHRHTKSCFVSSSSSGLAPAKHSRGPGKFFSKAK